MAESSNGTVLLNRPMQSTDRSTRTQTTAPTQGMGKGWNSASGNKIRNALGMVLKTMGVTHSPTIQEAAVDETTRAILSVDSPFTQIRQTIEEATREPTDAFNAYMERAAAAMREANRHMASEMARTFGTGSVKPEPLASETTLEINAKFTDALRLGWRRAKESVKVGGIGAALLFPSTVLAETSQLRQHQQLLKRIERDLDREEAGMATKNGGSSRSRGR